MSCTGAAPAQHQEWLPRVALTCLAQAAAGGHCSAPAHGEAGAVLHPHPLRRMLGCWKRWALIRAWPGVGYGLGLRLRGYPALKI